MEQLKPANELRADTENMLKHVEEWGRHGGHRLIFIRREEQQVEQQSDEARRIPTSIRPYAPGDLAACRGLWAELTEWHRHIYESPGIGGPDPGGHFDEHLKRVGAEHIWVAEAGGRVAGLAGLIPGEGEAELEPLVVSEAYRGLGIGRELAETVVAAARQGGVRQLKVRPVARNERAIRFFHELGFDILGHIELFMDFGPEEGQVWRWGERMADREFRV